MPDSPAQPFSGIFVSYRRHDSSGHAGRLFDKLAAHFGKERIFMDIDTIEPGEDFVTVIENAVSSCEILIAIIGREWLSSGDKNTGRLDNPLDFVRLEIATALQRDIRVIPVLVQRASMPKPQDLPDDLAKFSRRNAIELTDLRWQTDVDQLIVVMEKVLAKREAARLAETAEQKENERAEQERLRLIKEEADRREAEVAAKQAEQERQLREKEEQQRREEAERILLAEKEAERVAAERQQQEREKSREAEERKRQEAEEASRRAEQQRAQEEVEKKARAEKERIRQEDEEAERQRAANQSVAAPLMSSLQPGVFQAISMQEGGSKRTMLFVIIASVAVVAIVVFIWTMLGSGGEQQSANSTAKQPATQSTSASAATAVPGMVYVQGGEFKMGRDNADDPNERPAHPVSLESFLIDQHEVTRDEYAEFVRTGHVAPRDWANGLVPPGTGRKPVTNVKWDEAHAFCTSRGKRLPTEEEWELAARGTKAYIYPWGDVWQAGLANVQTKELAEVGKAGLSPCGAVDMVGNAWEWTASPLTAYPNGALSQQVGPDWRVIRGGSYADSPRLATTTSRVGYPPRDASDYSKIGFRCASDVNKSTTQ